MSFEKRLLSTLNILMLISVPMAVLIVSLPGDVSVDYTVVYSVLGALALTMVVGNILINHPSPHGKLLPQMPYFFVGIIIYTFLVSAAIYFSGGLRSPLFYLVFGGPLLAGVCYALPLAIGSTAITSLFYVITIVFDINFQSKNIQRLAFNVLFLFIACVLSNRVALEMRKHEQAKDEALNLSEFLRRLEKAKSDFVSVVSHELRTPLTSIKGFSEILRSKDMPAEKRREFYGIIHNESERLSRLITNLLNLSTIEAGAELKKGMIDLSEILKEEIELMRSQSEIHTISYTQEGRLPLIYADEDRVRQIFKNILSNALKYSPHGGPVEVKTGSTGKFVWFSVKDCGIGIPPDELPGIFEKFRRVERGMASAISGTGLGLAIVKSLVEMHRGRVEVSSKVNQGSTFTVYLPIRGE